jgi:tetratricopeptide (TPR) repeat protein
VFLAGLLPVSGLVPFEFQTYSTVADRYAYLAMAGPAMAIAFALRGRTASMRWRAGAMLVIIALSLLSFRQSLTWKDDAALFAQAARVNPRSLAVRSNDGYRAGRAGDLPAAERAYRDVLERDPSHLPTRYQLGNILLRAQRPAEAAVQYQYIAATAPLHEQLYLNLGFALIETQQYAEALRAYEMAVRSNPRSAEAFAHMGLIYESTGDLTRARNLFRQALALDPAQPAAREGLSRLGNATDSAQ